MTMWPPNLKTSAFLLFIFRTLTILGALAITLRTIVTVPLAPDSYTHLAVGQYILTNKHIPTHTDLSFKQSEPSLEWVSHSWLSDVLFFMAYSIHPVFATIGILIPLLLFSLWLLRVLMNHLCVDDSMQSISLALATLLGASFWKLHPLVFAIPFALTLIILLLYTNEQSRLRWFVPIVFVLWANFAGGFVMIPILFFLIVLLYHLFLSLLDRFGIAALKQKMSIHVLSPFVKLFAVSFIATLVNPLGLRLWSYPLTLLAVVRSMWSLSSLPGAIMIINQNFLKSAPSSVWYTIFLIWCIVYVSLLIYCLINKRHVFTNEVLRSVPLIFFLFLGVAWVRFIPLAAFSSLPFFALLTHSQPAKNPASTKRYALVVFVCVGLLGLIVFLLIAPPRPLAVALPQKQIALIRQFQLPPNIFTTFDLTGYVLYEMPGLRVDLDAQDDLFEDNILINIYSWPIMVAPDYLNSLVEKYTINTILINKNIGGIAAALTQNPDWALVYFDTSGFLFVRKSSVSKQWVDDYALRYVDLSKNLGFASEKLQPAMHEMEQFVTRFPESILAKGQLATMYRLSKRFSDAQKVLETIPRDKWNYTVYTEMGRIFAAQGLCRSAETNFLQALADRSERDYSRTVLDLAILYAGCFRDNIKAKHYFVRYNSYLITPPEREKLRRLMQSFDISLE